MKTNKLLMLPVILALLACGKVEVSVLRTATPTAAASMTPTLPISSQVGLPSPTPVAVPGGLGLVKVFLIALEDNGRLGPQVGCGDSLVPITVAVPRGPNFLEAGLGHLFEKNQFYDAETRLYNALYQSDLQVVRISSEQGKTIVRLTGTIMLGGTCDAPRVETQIEQTALQLSAGNDIAVFVDDVPLEEVLSQR